jgi:predicted phosphodiesterase
MGKQTIGGEIVVEYLERYGNELMKLTLAKLIYQENPEAFASVDAVRNVIRYYCGSTGAVHIGKLQDKRFVGACQPTSQAKPREDFMLPKVNNNCLLMSDIHVPYHDESAVDAALDWAKSHGVNTIILNGDFMDFYVLSRFAKDPRERDLSFELAAGYEMMYYIANRMPKAKIYFLPGNHEFRLESYLRSKAPELLGAEPGLADLEFYLKFSDFGVTYLKSSQLIRAGKLFIGHGDNFNGGAGGVNPSRTFTLRTGGNFIGGHFHRTSEDSNTNINGQTNACWSMGCLCGMWPEYAKYNKWNQGFANVRLGDDGAFRVFNARIFNGKVL